MRLSGSTRYMTYRDWIMHHLSKVNWNSIDISLVRPPVSGAFSALDKSHIQWNRKQA